MNDNICTQSSGGNQFHHSYSFLKITSKVSGRRFGLVCLWKKVCFVFFFSKFVMQSHKFVIESHLRSLIKTTAVATFSPD